MHRQGAERMGFPWEKPSDSLNVAEAAALLEISEFRVFELAYTGWFGGEPDERVIEPHFMAYMFRRAVPPWVRHFTRHVIDLAADGTLDPSDFGIAKRWASRRDIARGKLYLVYLTVSVVALVLLADLTAEWMGASECMFPPCY